MIGLSIASDWVRDWCEFVGPLIQQSEGIPMQWMLSWKFPYLSGHLQLWFKSMVFQVFSLSQKWSHRIGSLGNRVTNLLEHILCSSPYSRIGFGRGGSGYENAWGKRALWRVNNGDKNIKVFGYIFLYLRHWTALLQEKAACNME